MISVISSTLVTSSSCTSAMGERSFENPFFDGGLVSFAIPDSLWASGLCG